MADVMLGAAAGLGLQQTFDATVWVMRSFDLCMNASCNEYMDLEKHAKDLYTAMASVVKVYPRQADNDLVDLTLKKIVDLVQCLTSIVASQSGSDFRTKVRNFFLASADNQARMALRDELAYYSQVLQRFLVKPTVCNDSLEVPNSKVGLNRISPVLAFLGESSSQYLRVICICGLAGVGKSTLLLHLWRDHLERTSCSAKAFVGIGKNADELSICRLQQCILDQLGFENTIVMDSAFGRGELSKSFRELRDQRTPVFLAINDVLSPKHLEDLLPKIGYSRESHLPSMVTTSNSSILPVKSCIALTCRDERVVRSLLNICGLQKDNKLQVFCYNPPLLSPQEGRRLFIDCAHMQMDASKHEKLLGALVPRCQGLPLALDCLGKEFRTESMRMDRQWRSIEKQVACMEGRAMTQVRKALQTSYDALDEPCQAAFLDIVELFIGWPWDVVECIVGDWNMLALEESSLISQVECCFECCDAVSNITFSLSQHFYPQLMDIFQRQGRVWMHDLTYQFGKYILPDNTVGYKQFSKQVSPDPHLGHSIISSWRNVILTVDTGDTQLVSRLKDASNLQMLAVSSHLKPSCSGSCCKKPVRSQQGHRNLGYLMLGDLGGLKNSDMEEKVLSDIRGIHLKNCGGIDSLPALCKLQKLCVDDCNAFQDFSKDVQGWECLRSLILVNCPAIVQIPKELGDLYELQFVAICACINLEEFPRLRHARGLSHLILQNCPALKTMGDVSCHLEELHISCCKSLSKLPSVTKLKSLTIDFDPQQQFSTGSVVALEKLELTRSECFEKFAEDPGNLSALKYLRLKECGKLQQLPSSICRLRALETLFLTGCESFEELPEDLGNVASLKTLAIFDLKKLKQLPSSIHRLTALEKLNFKGCETLKKLPEDLGALALLKRLALRDSKQLVGLPSFICSLTALETLDLGGCESLKELPRDIGSVASLKVLVLQGCKQLQELPSSICKLTALMVLDLRGCESLDKLPVEIETVDSLETLVLKDCKKLQQLPSNICRLTTVRWLDLGGCKSLMNVPQDMKAEVSSKFFALKGCKQLRQLISSMCKLTELRWLDLGGCESLVEFSEDIGAVASLETVIGGCKQPRKSPSAICSWTTIPILNLGGCESLEELPDNIEDVAPLKMLVLKDCKKLRKLPFSICQLMALLVLDLRGCASLEDLPEDIGDVLSLQMLLLKDCEKLQQLPNSMWQLRELRVLDLRGCRKLGKVAEDIKDLPYLEILMDSKETSPLFKVVDQLDLL